MLRFLSVRHLAVIEELELEFEPGLNVLTGETGAGKSVLVEAIDLLVGGRSSSDLVRTGESQATIQAIFETPEGREVIVRREISAQGRSRAFIDDALATTAALRDLGAGLLELHGQHEHQALVDPTEHADLLDAFAGHQPLVHEVAAGHEEWRTAVEALERTQLSDREKRARIEIASFQLQDIEKVGPTAGEDETLTAERGVLANADRLSRLAGEAYRTLYDGDAAVLANLGSVWKRLTDLASLDARFAPYVEQRDDIKSRLEDLAYFLRGYDAGLDASPARLQAVEDRLAAIERLKRRYGPSLEDVVATHAALRDTLAELGASDEQAAALAERERTARDRFLAAARTLSASRAEAARRMGSALEKDLAELAMAACRMDVRVRPTEAADHWTARGMDEVEFFFSPNPGEDLRALARIASGGELSRLMLALRIIATRGESPRTLIFDEVDAGIGGAAADAVGARLQALGRRHQVLCVTHLAQIAARAGTHFQIAKAVQAGRTITRVSRLDDAGRESEVGRMIAGATVSAHVLASARELLASRRADEQKANARTSPEPRPNEKAKGKRGGR